MEKGRTFETVVGVFVLIVAAFFFNYVYRKSGWQKTDGYVLSAKFDRADGLAEGSDVKISGIRIGKILSLKVDPETFFAIVTFCVPRSLNLPKDTSANVASDGLFGGKYLSLVPGGDEEVLKEGDEIESTSGPVNLESLIGKFLFSQKGEASGKDHSVATEEQE
ncbi:MAG: outer membrane lipid asymmetry maintenance protein MlaD [Holosporaceae bacterium]|jgi:phospholipid/cholesterol/gamma-HCH transport system substrate-binding protein|nr:outer membrane lipid asymmetry maintenance protein MlaD [Holosporaceae bacterium]